MNKRRLLLGVVFALIFVSCTENRIYEEFHSFSTQTWSDKDSVVFDLQKGKVPPGKNLIGLRYTDSYPYANVYIRIISEDSLGSILDNKLVNVPLFESKSGQPKGTGFGNTYTFYDTIPFQLPDLTSTVIFLQYMRQDGLPGIEAVGLKIVQ